MGIRGEKMTVDEQAARARAEKVEALLAQLTAEEKVNLVDREPEKLALLEAALKRHRARTSGIKAERQGVPLDEELLQHLSDLGYVND